MITYHDPMPVDDFGDKYGLDIEMRKVEENSHVYFEARWVGLVQADEDIRIELWGQGKSHEEAVNELKRKTQNKTVRLADGSQIIVPLLTHPRKPVKEWERVKCKSERGAS